MLWCQYLPWAALLGCPQVPAVPRVDIEQITVITYVAELLVNLPTVTVSTTIGIAATPISHAIPASLVWPAHTPRPAPHPLDMYAEGPDPIEPEVINTPLSYHDLIIAFGDWFENDGFYIDVRVTPLRLLWVSFAIGWLHLAFMVLFKDYKVFGRVVKSLLKGFFSGSKVLWTLLLGGAMYLSYDKLQEDPAILIMHELIAWNNRRPDFFVRSGRRLAVEWGLWRGMVPRKPYPGYKRRIGNIWGRVLKAQRLNEFTPKTLTEVLVGSLVGLYLLGRGSCHFCLKTLVVIWVKIEPTVSKAPPFLCDRLTTLYHFVDAELISHGYTWKSLAKELFVTIPVAVYHTLVGCYRYARLVMWLKIQNPCTCKGRTPFEIDTKSATSWSELEAFRELASMSIWDIADVIMHRNDLLRELQYQETRIRTEILQDVSGTTKELGQRALSWRTSHEAMCQDYNHCRRTLDLIMSRIVCAMMDIDANGPEARPFFTSSYLVTVPEPLPNGLHYKPSPMCAQGPCMTYMKKRCEANLTIILKNMKMRLSGPCRRGFIPNMDLYNTKTWSFDLKRIGFEFATFAPENNPVELHRRIVKPYRLREMEDYAVEGRILEWYYDLPARLEKKKETSHPFYRTWSMM